MILDDRNLDLGLIYLSEETQPYVLKLGSSFISWVFSIEGSSFACKSTALCGSLNDDIVATDDDRELFEMIYMPKRKYDIIPPQIIAIV
jgi:hypothetical protein